MFFATQKGNAEKTKIFEKVWTVLPFATKIRELRSKWVFGPGVVRWKCRRKLGLENAEVQKQVWRKNVADSATRKGKKGEGMGKSWRMLVQGWFRAGSGQPFLVQGRWRGSGVFVCSVIAGANEKHTEFLVVIYGWFRAVQGQIL